MSIRFEHLTKSYGGNVVVRDVSLDISDGELCVLLGPSGSGKSTLLRIVAGLTEPDAGTIRLHGEDVTRTPPQRRGVGFVFQHYALFRHMSVSQNVEFALRVRGVPRRTRATRRDELLELVGLAGFGSRRPSELSGGQQQRVALARALAHAPRVLLLDEPFGALDARIRSELRGTVRRIQRELRITTVFVTHDQEEAFELADRIALLHHGRLVETGSPGDLYLRPGTEFAATFLGTANLVVGTRQGGGVRIGDLALPLAPAAAAGDGSRVQVLFRPEDVAVKDAEEALGWPSLGRATVEARSFVGAFERLRLRLPVRGVRAISPTPPFGADYVLVDAVRSQHQARRFPLAPGDPTYVGLRRIHALAHPGLSFLVVEDRGPASETAAALARPTHARLTRLLCEATSGGAVEGLIRSPDPIGEALRTHAPEGAFDLVVVGSQEGLDAALACGDHHVMLAPERGASFRKVLFAFAPGEPGEAGIRFAGRLVRHLDAEATLVTVASPAEREPAERFLSAGARTLAPLGIAARTRLRTGDPDAEIRAEAEEGGYDLVVVGAPGSPATRSLGRPVVFVRPRGGGP